MAMRLAFSNTAESVMSAARPLIGGVIAASFGYFAVFWVAIACEAVALVLLLTLVEERARSACSSKRKRRRRSRDDDDEPCDPRGRRGESMMFLPHNSGGGKDRRSLRNSVGGFCCPVPPEPRLANRS